MKVSFLLGIFALFSSATAYKCFQCTHYENNNKTDVGCNAEPVPEKYLLDCKMSGIKDWQCAKQKGKTIDDDDNEYKYVSRYCSPGKNYDAKCKESDALGSPYGIVKKGFQCYCQDKEGCNNSNNLSFGVASLFISFFALSLRYLY